VQYEYPSNLLEQLARHGIRPRPSTPPARVRELLNDLYRFELRRLRGRLRRGEIRTEDYHLHVIEARQRYWLLSVPVPSWVKTSEDGT
jgi:hypothetical protein